MHLCFPVSSRSTEMCRRINSHEAFLSLNGPLEKYLHPSSNYRSPRITRARPDSPHPVTCLTPTVRRPMHIVEVRWGATQMTTEIPEGDLTLSSIAYRSAMTASQIAEPPSRGSRGDGSKSTSTSGFPNDSPRPSQRSAHMSSSGSLGLLAFY